MRYRAYYGFNPSEYISFDSRELPRIILAWQTGSIIRHEGSFLDGKLIKHIDPDHRYFTGHKDDYFPEAYEISAACPRDAYERESNIAFELVSRYQKLPVKQMSITEFAEKERPALIESPKK